MALGVYPEKLAAERELFTRLDISELEELAAQSQALVDRAIAMARAHGHRVPQIEGSVLGAPVRGEGAGAPAETPTVIDVNDGH